MVKSGTSSIPETKIHGLSIHTYIGTEVVKNCWNIILNKNQTDPKRGENQEHIKNCIILDQTRQRIQEKSKNTVGKVLLV